MEARLTGEMVHLKGINDEAYAEYLLRKEAVTNFNPSFYDGLGRGYNAEGLRYVSPEVGYVDQDEEYY